MVVQKWCNSSLPHPFSSFCFFPVTVTSEIGKHQSIGSTAVVRCCLLAWHCWSITTVKLSEGRKRENCTAFAKQKFCSKGKRKSSVALVFVVVCVCVLRKWKGKKRERKEKEKTVTTRLASISDTFGQTKLNTTAAAAAAETTASLSPSHTVIGNRSRMLKNTAATLENNSAQQVGVCVFS